VNNMARKKIIDKKDESVREAEEAAKKEAKEAKKEKEAERAAKKGKKSSKKTTAKGKEKVAVESEGKTPEEKIDAFNLEELPETKSAETEPSEIEQEMEKEEGEEKEEIQEERFYIVPLAKGYHKGASWYRSHKAISVLRVFVKRHMKPEGDVYISQELNERIWENGIRNPPRKIRIRCTKSVDGVVRAYLA
jgi:large subunit ribosomal protein L31e